MQMVTLEDYVTKWWEYWTEGKKEYSSLDAPTEYMLLGEVLFL